MAAEPELKQLGRYKIDRVLGKGAMGMVYAGTDTRLHRTVAIKTILKSAVDEDTAREYSMRFVREAQAVARLNHPNIVQVYDFGEEGDIAYIVMEFIKGKELKNFFDANERFELKEAVRIMCELCDALHFAHEAGIIHRDIKPANVMIDHNGKVKLADFGVARITDASATEKTQAGTMVGTPAYMSPEQITGGNIDRRSDIFSAGIILYQFLTGEKPFTGSGAWTIAKKIIQDNPPPPSTINKGIPPVFDQIVNKALAKSVEARYQTAKDLANALRRALEGKGEDEEDRTVVAPLGGGAMPAPQVAAARPEASARTAVTASGTQEVELEFWRSIKDGNDPEDFELYIQQFPNGIYAALAKRKIAKLRGISLDDSKAKEQEKREMEEAARREAEVRAKLAEEKARLEKQLAEREAEFKRREAEAEAKRIAEIQARAEAEAKREAELKAKYEAEAKARAEAVERARKEAAELAERARREAEEKARREAEALAEKARKEAEEKARIEAERVKAEAERARREAEERARKEAEKARAEAEALAKAKAEAEARAKKEAEERARREAEAAKREAELKKKLAEAPRAKLPVAPIIAAIVAIAGIGGGAYYYLTAEQRARQEALTAALEAATKAAEELKAAQAKQLAALQELEKARAAEEAARKAGDAAKLKEAQEAAKRAEAEAAKQAEIVKQREAAAAKARDDAKKAQEAAKQAEKAKAEKKMEVAAVSPPPAPAPAAEPAKPAAEQPADAATQKPAAAEPGKGSAPTKTAVAAAAQKGTAPKAPAPAKAPQTAAPAVVAPVPQPDTTPRLTREEREELKRQQEAAEKGVQVAGAAPAAATATTDLMAEGRRLEAEGKYKEAVRLYRKAARAGSGPAAKRLGEIYDKGVPGIERDYAESLQWYELARQRGETVETAGRR